MRSLRQVRESLQDGRDVTKTPDHPECIRCGMCVKACPTGAVSFRCGLSRGAKEKENPAGKQAVEK